LTHKLHIQTIQNMDPFTTTAHVTYKPLLRDHPIFQMADVGDEFDIYPEDSASQIYSNYSSSDEDEAAPGPIIAPTQPGSSYPPSTFKLCALKDWDLVKRSTLSKSGSKRGRLDRAETVVNTPATLNHQLSQDAHSNQMTPAHAEKQQDGHLNQMALAHSDKHQDGSNQMTFARMESSETLLSDPEPVHVAIERLRRENQLLRQQIAAFWKTHN